MDLSASKHQILSSTALKLLACAFMLVDHVGVRLFPNVLVLRIIGRLAFPIFAFFIGEGCRYTSNKLRHFLQVFILGAICETAYIIYTGAWYGNILLTFSLSILLVYLMQWSNRSNGFMGKAVFVIAVAALAVITNYVNFDYGYFGMVLPLLAACIGEIKDKSGQTKHRLSRNTIRLVLFTAGIMLTVIKNPLGWYQLFALLAVPLLAMYSGKPGKLKLKYFFYIFYPVHLLLIELAAMLIY